MCVQAVNTTSPPPAPASHATAPASHATAPATHATAPATHAVAPATMSTGFRVVGEVSHSIYDLRVKLHHGELSTSSLVYHPLLGTKDLGTLLHGEAARSSSQHSSNADPHVPVPEPVPVPEQQPRKVSRYINDDHDIIEILD